ncbi:MAG: BadF/BadG/BcrA/BcrD ATPase family protein [Thermus sp.]|uniref:BadF/BadG/BcrA/BcrD ATPase family protein n=1 Tax=Thermus sp. TaxID=275 RepID=UPI003D0B8514
MIFLGADGGGTKTRFVAVDEAGKVVAERVLGTAYLPAVGREGVEAVFREALKGLPPPAYVVAGLGGYGEVAAWDRAYREALEGVLPCPFLLQNDVALAFEAAFGEGEGVLVVAGTGSMAYGRGPLGEGRAGGYGPLFGDEGSAYWIGLRALNRASRAEDGRAPPTGLLRLPQRFGQGDLLGLLAFLEAEPRALRSRVASLAQEVDRLAEEGDEGALEVLEGAAEELALLALALSRRVGAKRAAYMGGVFRSRRVAEGFARRLQAEGLALAGPPEDVARYAAEKALRLYGGG